MSITTPLHEAVRNCHIDAIRVLLINGANVDIRDECATTPLIDAALWCNKHPNIIELLLDYGADIDAIDGRPWTPLYMAAWYNYTNIALLLLDRGANGKLGGKCHYSPTYWAEYHQNKILLNRLIE
jgi:ankyrin repeat protein